MLQGTIKGLGILCTCSLCKGCTVSVVVIPMYFNMLRYSWLMSALFMVNVHKGE